MNKISNFTILSIFLLLFSNIAIAEKIRFWTTEEQPARLAKQQAMAEDFKKRTDKRFREAVVETKTFGI